MKLYVVHYGTEVPYKHVFITTWKETTSFLKKTIDQGIPIRSVTIEYSNEDDETCDD